MSAAVWTGQIQTVALTSQDGSAVLPPNVIHGFRLEVGGQLRHLGPS